MNSTKYPGKVVPRISETITIHAAPDRVWHALTDSNTMPVWMGEPEMQINVQSDWKINSPILITGFHHVKFQNKGLILAFDKEKKLSYSHLSSVSRLPDKPESYSILEFSLEPVDKQTQLTLTIENFPAETIYKHLALYWKVTLRTIKEFVENGKM